MTTPETLQTVEPGEFHMPAAHLIRALSNALVCAGADPVLPALTTVRFAFDGADLTTAATDKYVAVVEEVELDAQFDHAQPALQFVLQTRDVKQLLSALKAHKIEPVHLAADLWAGTLTVRFSFDGAQQTYPLDVEHTFPKVDALIPTGEGTPVAKIGFSAALVARLGKIVTGDKRGKETFAMTLFTERKPVRIDYTDGPTVALMPRALSPDEK